MIVSRVLREQAGIQYQGVTETPDGESAIDLSHVLFVGNFKRGRLDRPMKITAQNIRSVLGFDPMNRDYTAIEDALKTGAPYVWVQRIPSFHPSQNGGTLLEFDYAVIRYVWSDAGGIDLDTRASITMPFRGVAVGWGKAVNDGPYIKWNGDNVDTGLEAVLLDMKQLMADYPNQKLFEISLSAFWYKQMNTGEFTLELETYSGGVMAQDGFNFVNQGGRVIQRMTLDASVSDDRSNDYAGELFAKLTFDSDKKSGLLQKTTAPVTNFSLVSTSGTIIFSGDSRLLVLKNSAGTLLYPVSGDSSSLVLRNSSDQVIFSE